MKPIKREKLILIGLVTAIALAVGIPFVIQVLDPEGADAVRPSGVPGVPK